MPVLFDSVREKLEKQYENACYDADSGLSKEELQARLCAHRSENPNEPRILTRAWLFKLICEEGRIVPEPNDYFAGKVEHHNLMVDLRNEWMREEGEREFANDAPVIDGSFRTVLDTSHTCPDWRNILQFGFTGLRDRAKGKDGDFYKAVTMVYGGAATLACRIGDVSGLESLSVLSERPPQTFREALQLAYLYHDLQEMEGEELRTMGRFDEQFNHFYLADLEAGRLTRDEAKEMLKYFWIKFYARWQGKRFGKPFLYGPKVNELSYVAFEAYREMSIVDPKFHVCISDETEEEFLNVVVASILEGNTSIVVSNYPRVVKMLEENGKAPEDARDYILIGCYEPGVMGKEMNWSGGSSINLAKSVEIVLESGDFQSFDELMDKYMKTLEEQFTILADRSRRWEKLWPQVNPSPFLSGTMDACLQSGNDVSSAGAKYNTTGCVCAAVANAADSLAAIRQLVFEEKVCTLGELKKALDANWEGYEELRLTAMHRVPKWGNNDNAVDEIAVRIAQVLGPRINNEPNARGGKFQAALYAIINTAQDYGRKTGALPDGRLAGEPLSINTGATPGMDKKGATSLVNSVTKVKLDDFPSGTVLDIMLHPSAVKGDDGRDVVKSVIDTHFSQGGMAIQFNIFDADKLREAQKNPQKYANLQVRVCGWSVRFCDLSTEEQDIYIRKAEVA